MTVHYHGGRPRGPTEETMRYAIRIKSMRAEGRTFQEIGDLVGLDRAHVFSIWKSYVLPSGLTTPPKKLSV